MHLWALRILNTAASGLGRSKCMPGLNLRVPVLLALGTAGDRWRHSARQSARTQLRYSPANGALVQPVRRLSCLRHDAGC